MQICGIICEFNPFHNGHKYLISQAKKLTNSTIVCLMSGDFVQRGEPAIQDKYTRAKNAIEFGADVVLELPTIYACSNAENFAFGAIKTLDALGASQIAFGIEETNLEILDKIAEIKLKNSETFQNAFKNEIKNGINFNTALKRAIAKEFDSEKNILEILSKPNNILAIEYLTAIKKLKSAITLIAIDRIDNGYNSITNKGKFLSAGSIREKLSNNENVDEFIPAKLDKSTLFDEISKERLDSLIIGKIRNSNPEKLEKFYDYSEGIEYRIKKQADNTCTAEELLQSTITPRYRAARVQKLILFPSLNITKKIVNTAKTSKPFSKVLAISKSNKEILSQIKKSKINLIVTNKDYENLNQKQKQIIDIDLTASNLYNLATKKPNNHDKKMGTLFL